MGAYVSLHYSTTRLPANSLLESYNVDVILQGSQGLQLFEFEALLPRRKALLDLLDCDNTALFEIGGLENLTVRAAPEHLLTTVLLHGVV